MHFSPHEEGAIRKEFRRLANMSQAELRARLETPQSPKVGVVRKGAAESVDCQSANRIPAIRDTAVDDLTDADDRHMRKVTGDCRRHLAQRPAAPQLRAAMAVCGSGP